MKKIKLMLLSLSILAVVGAALAFKAKTDFEFCTAPTVDTDPAKACKVACPTDTGLQSNPGGIFICTTPTSGDDTRPCKDAQLNDLTCQASIQLTVEH